MKQKWHTCVGDVLEVANELSENIFDACLCDPPYGLKFMGERWDYELPSIDTWKAIGRMMKPGAYLLAFGGTRTHHRLTCSIEDAGFEIRDVLMWLYGTGFPKSLDVGKAIDKAAGAEREVIGQQDKRGAYDGFTRLSDGHSSGYGGFADKRHTDITVPSTRAAQQWDGYGTALKPAWEPIILARKPFKSTVAANVLKHGVGGLNIDGCKIGTGDDRTQGGATGKRISDDEGYGGAWKDARKGRKRPPGGRFPANIILDAEAAAMLDGQNNGVSRFFYCTKASKKERTCGDQVENKHPTVKPIALNRYLAKLIQPPKSKMTRRIVVPFAGTGSEMIGALLEGWEAVFGIENDKRWTRVAKKRIKRFVK